MKKRTDPRHIKRAHTMKDLFTWDFQKRTNSLEAQKILDHITEIDEIIQAAATDRPVKQINKIDLSILRLAVFEVIIKKDAPVKVIIDEAIELGKEYGGDSSASFINGVLGKVVEKNSLIVENS